MFTKTKEKVQKSPLEIVQEIHKKVLTSGDRCLKESEVLLSSPEAEDFELATKMAGLGFSNAQEVKEKHEELEKHKLAIERAKNVRYYSQHYPMHKYIPFEDMEAICKEYGLIFGADQHYIGSIPKRSQKEIVNFKLRKEDYLYHKGVFKQTKSEVKGNKNIREGVIVWSEISEEEYMRETAGGKNLVQNNDRTHYISNSGYFNICAPPEMFKMDGVVLDGVELKKVVKIEETIHDPVCLKPVKNGFLVVAVWGEEAAIAAMQNPKHN